MLKIVDTKKTFKCCVKYVLKLNIPRVSILTILYAPDNIKNLDLCKFVIYGNHFLLSD